MAISQSETIEAAEVGAPGLERKVGLAWLALAWEALWPRLVPMLSAVALFVAAAHLDLFAGLEEVVERVEELFLRAFFASEELDVVDQQHVRAFAQALLHQEADGLLPGPCCALAELWTGHV